MSIGLILCVLLLFREYGAVCTDHTDCFEGNALVCIGICVTQHCSLDTQCPAYYDICRPFYCNNNTSTCAHHACSDTNRVCDRRSRLCIEDIKVGATQAPPSVSIDTWPAPFIYLYLVLVLIALFIAFRITHTKVR